MDNSFLLNIKKQNKLIKKSVAKKDIYSLINLIKNYKNAEDKKNLMINSLNKISTKSNYFLKINILIISNLSYNVFKRVIEEKFLLSRAKIDLNFENYNTILNSKINFEKYDSIIIFPDKSDFEEISKITNKNKYTINDLSSIKKFYNMLFKNIKLKSSARIFLSNLNMYSDYEYKKFSNVIKINKFSLINKVNSFFKNTSLRLKFFLVDNNTLSNKFSLRRRLDLEKFNFARIPFSSIFAEYFFPILSNYIVSSFGKTKKVLVLDLDNTLWGGILGDDGFNNIEINSKTIRGKSFRNFQKTILNLKKRGILLAICSKNNIENVKNVFKKNKNLILKYKDFIVVRCNWKNKANNIIEISEELNLNLDSFVFIDDNKAERELVRSYLPKVEVPEIPENPIHFSDIVLNSFLFESTNFTREDASRNKSYLADKKRNSLKTKSVNNDEYLKSLEMKADISSFKKNNLNRIVQLFQRSNQFNLTTNRYNHLQLKKIISDKSFVTFQVSLKDKFFKYGIISLLVCRINNTNLIIENWVMSCRVLSRTLENFILSQLKKVCKNKKLTNIIGVYKPSLKNFMVKELYVNLGFKSILIKKKKTEYVFNTDKNLIRKHYIK